jgi:hypothetical protein
VPFLVHINHLTLLHLVIESTGLSIINIGECECQHAWVKREIRMGIVGSIYMQILGQQEGY